MFDYALFTLAFLASALAPGADTTLVLTRALEDQRKAWIAGLGITMAKVVLLIIAYLGASSLILGNPTLVLLAKLFGTGFLGYRALVLWRRNTLTTQNPDGSLVGNFGLGFATGFTNPQPLAFYLAIVPQVANRTELPQLALIVFVGFSLVTALYANLAKPISRFLTRRGPKILNRSIAILLGLVAVWILLR